MMSRITEYLIRYPIWVSVIMFSLFGFGLLSLSELRFSFFPDIEPDTIVIQVAYPGASPEEVAEGVVLKIEENLDGLEGVERVTSISRENFGTVNVEITRDANINDVVADVKNAVDRINSFPIDVEKPIIFERKFRMKALSVIMYGDADLHNLKYIAEEFRDKLLATEEISLVNIEGLPSLEFSIEVAEADLRRYQISFDEITSAISRANVNVSGGKFDTEHEEVLIRAWGRNYHAEDLQDIPIRGNADGTVIYLGDVAKVSEQWEDIPDKRYYNSRNAIVLNIDRSKQEDIIAIDDVVLAYLDEFNEEHSTVEALMLDDQTIPLRQRIDLLTKNGVVGLLLVIICLGLFLNLRMSFWVSLGIPISFAGMFIVAWMVGITINVISLFGMIIVIGILVDDAIVVGENIFSHFERGKTPIEAAVLGTREMFAPVTTSVMTTVIAFTPFFFLDGILGKFIWQMAVVVVASLLFSLFEAFFILPAHLAHSKGLHPHKEDSNIRKQLESGIKYLTERIYAPVLKKTLQYNWVAVVIPVTLVLLTVGMIRGGLIGVTLFPFIDADVVPINISLVSGRQEAVTDSVLARIERACWTVNEELASEREDGADVILGIKRDIGSNDFGESGSHTGRLLVQLLDGEVRDMPSYEVSNRVRAIVGPLPEVQNITYGRSGHFGKPISISLLGNDFEQLDRARNLLVAELRRFSTIKDVTDSDQLGRRELDITLKPRAYALGLSLRDVAGQVRQGFFGQEVQRIQRGRDEIRVWVRYREEDRAALGFLEQMRIRTNDGHEYPFSELAEYSIERGITTINHLDRHREIRIEANLADVEGDLPPILAEIQEEVLPAILGEVHGVKADFEGQLRSQGKTMRTMRTAFPLALLGMFILVVLVFRSYGQAFLIFSLIPIGILGAIWGHGIHGIQLNMLSIYGVIALSGIIVNDSIVLVDQINRNLRNNQKVYDAVFNASISRLRPIILTTMTTSLGLAPLILETSRQAQFLIPMAVSVAYGLLFGTLILLLILPSGYLLFNSVRLMWARLGTKELITPEAVEPAIKELQTSGMDKLS